MTAPDRARFDVNNLPTLTAVSNADGSTPVTLWADPTTHKLITDASGGGGGGVQYVTGDTTDPATGTLSMGQVQNNDGSLGEILPLTFWNSADPYGGQLKALPVVILDNSGVPGFQLDNIQDAQQDGSQLTQLVDFNIDPLDFTVPADGSNPFAIPVQIVDDIGAQITSFGGGVQYTAGVDPLPGNVTGNALVYGVGGTDFQDVEVGSGLPVADPAAATHLPTIDSNITLIQTDISGIKTDTFTIQGNQTNGTQLTQLVGVNGASDPGLVHDGVAAISGIPIMGYSNAISAHTFIHVDDFDNLNVLANTTSTASYPMYDRRDLGLTSISTDSAGAVQTFSEVTTDEGTSRVNFTGSSLFTTPGTATFVNGSADVTGTGFTTVDAYYMDYIKLDSDGESAWAQIAFINSDTSITLLLPYTGSSSTGTYDLSSAVTITGTGATISVATGQATIALGTNTSAASNLYRAAGAPPIRNGIYSTQLSISQRAANQDIYVGMESDPSTPRYFARFHFSGTNNTQVVTETAYNPTTTPTSSETESNTVTLPNAAATSSVNKYRILQEVDKVTFYINDVLVATHIARLPHVAIQALFGNIRGVNSGTITNTNIVVNYFFLRNYERVDVIQTPSEVNISYANSMSTLPPAVVPGGPVGAASDKFGRLVVLPNGTRDITKPMSQLTLTTTTTETTLIAGSSNVFNDITMLSVVNSSVSACQVDFRDSTAGTIRLSLYVPAGDMRGVSLTTPIPQATANNNWTAKCSTSVTSIIITGLYIANA